MQRPSKARARVILAALIATARPGDRVTSVADLSAAAGGLSTGATVAVLGEAIAAGQLVSTRGPHPVGGYWRTEEQASRGLATVLEEYRSARRAERLAWEAVEATLASGGDGW